jgi:hypothetical protein
MDRQVWMLVMDAVDRAIRLIKPAAGCRRPPRYSHRLIAGMYFWSVWHDRCLSWAADRTHYSSLFRPRRLPSISRFIRRVKEDVMQRLFQMVHEELAQSGWASPIGYLDGKPLTVSAVSKDPDARRGRISGGFAKGYKLHAFVSADRRIRVWSVMGLSVAEQSVALAMCPHLPAATPDALVLADSNYDSAPLHKMLASEQAGERRLLTPLKAQQRVKQGGHHPVTLRQMGAQRREAVAVQRRCPDLKRMVLKERNNIEGVFSVLACVGMLSALPAFVRRLDRVRRWTGAKIILYHARLRAQEMSANPSAA